MTHRETKNQLSGHPVESSAAAALRSFDLLGRRLAIPVTPQPGEGLPDLYLRAMNRNGEEWTSRLWPHFFGIPRKTYGHRGFVDVDVSSERFSEVLGTPTGASDIEPLRYSRTAVGVSRFFGTSIMLSQLSQHRRVSPRFLASHGYQKAIWTISSLTFDPANKEMLLDRCPNPACGEELTFARSFGISFCHACTVKGERAEAPTDLRDFPQPLVELDTFEHIDFACSLIDPQLEATRDYGGQLHHDLRSLTRGQVFEFIVLVGRLIDNAHGKPFSLSVTPPALDMAARAVRNWPAGIIDVADQVKHCWRNPTLSSGRGFKNPIFAEVAALRTYFDKDFANLLRTQLRAGLAALDTDVKVVRTREERFRRPFPKTRKFGGFDLQQSQERALYATLTARDFPAVRDEYKSIGLPYVEMASLYDKKLAQSLDGQFSQLFPDNTASSSISETIQARAVNVSGRLWPLYEAVNALSMGEITWANVLENVLRGNIQISLKPGPQPLIRRIFINDVENLKHFVSAPSGFYPGWADDLVLTTNDAGFYVGVAGFEVARLVTSGLLPSNGIKLSDVKQFNREYMCAAEVATCLALNNHAIKSNAVIFSTISKAGIPSIHSRPSIRYRRAISEYFSSLGYDRIWS